MSAAKNIDSLGPNDKVSKTRRPSGVRKSDNSPKAQAGVKVGPQAIVSAINKWPISDPAKKMLLSNVLGSEGNNPKGKPIVNA